MNPYRPLSIVVLGLCSALPLYSASAQRTSDQTLTLELLQRVEQLEKEVRAVRGELEVQRHQLDNLPDRAPPSTATPKPAPDTEAPPHAQAADPAPATTATAPAATTIENAEQTSFDRASVQWEAGKTTEAAASWNAFLSTYPQSTLAADARYWLGESHYANGNYEAAKEAFISLGVNHPQSLRIPDALLRLADTYQELGNPNRAREVLQKLLEVYPRTPAAKLADQRLQSLR